MSPDNLVIVAGDGGDGGTSTSAADNTTGAEARAGPEATAPTRAGAGAEAGTEEDYVPGVPPSGVVVHVNAAGAGPHGSLPHRLAEYLLEARGRALRRAPPQEAESNPPASTPISSVAVAVALQPAGEATGQGKKFTGQKRQRQEDEDKYFMKTEDTITTTTTATTSDATTATATTTIATDATTAAATSTSFCPAPVAAAVTTTTTAAGEGATRMPAVMVGGDPGGILNLLTSPGKAVQVDTIKPMLKPPGAKRLNPKYDKLLSNLL